MTFNYLPVGIFRVYDHDDHFITTSYVAALTGSITGLSRIPWTIKPVWAMLSDGVPLFGYRRKSYIVLGSFLCTLSCVVLGEKVKLENIRLSMITTMMQLKFTFDFTLLRSVDLQVFMDIATFSVLVASCFFTQLDLRFVTFTEHSQTIDVPHNILSFYPTQLLAWTNDT